jgi:putative acetyltransferase
VRLSLETGSGPAFEPALALYRQYGFVGGGPFAECEQSAFNQFLHLYLTTASAGGALLTRRPAGRS